MAARTTKSYWSPEAFAEDVPASSLEVPASSEWYVNGAAGCSPDAEADGVVVVALGGLVVDVVTELPADER